MTSPVIIFHSWNEFPGLLFLNQLIDQMIRECELGDLGIHALACSVLKAFESRHMLSMIRPAIHSEERRKFVCTYKLIEILNAEESELGFQPEEKATFHPEVAPATLTTAANSPFQASHDPTEAPLSPVENEKAEKKDEEESGTSLLHYIGPCALASGSCW